MIKSTTFTLDCDGRQLVAVLDAPAANAARTGLLVVTGGPQYRVGSHRLFTLLGRFAANNRFSCMRFDFRGSGDSAGSRVKFDALEPDIKAATDEFFRQAPELENIVLLGLCDGASAAMISAAADQRVTGLLLLNPWVHTDGATERARLRFYYPRKIFSVAFWRRLLGGKVKIRQSVADVRTAMSSNYDGEAGFLKKMLSGFSSFHGRTLVVLSENDLTAQEFRDLCNHDRGWQDAFSRPQLRKIDMRDANHTFSREQWRQQVFEHCVSFLQDIEGNPDSEAEA